MRKFMTKKRIMAYITVPLSFSFFGLLLIYGITMPVVNLAVSVSSRMIASSSLDQMNELSSIYDDRDLVERNSVPLSEVVIPYIGQHYANLAFEGTDFNRPIYWGDNDRILRRGIGQYSGSHMPGFGYPLMLSAHNLSGFYEIQFLEPGDIVSIRTNYGLYKYEVTHKEIHKYPFSGSYDLAKNEEELIMYSCYPFSILSSRIYDRYFVYAIRISGPDVR